MFTERSSVARLLTAHYSCQPREAPVFESSSPTGLGTAWTCRQVRQVQTRITFPTCSEGTVWAKPAAFSLPRPRARATHARQLLVVAGSRWVVGSPGGDDHRRMILARQGAVASVGGRRRAVRLVFAGQTKRLVGRRHPLMCAENSSCRRLTDLGWDEACQGSSLSSTSVSFCRQGDVCVLLLAVPPTPHTPLKRSASRPQV